MGREKQTIINRIGGKMKVSELIAEFFDLERNDPAMYFFAMELILENLLTNVKRYKKNAEKRHK